MLEHQGTLDYILSQFLPKGLAKLDPQVREILRAALAQARYMQVPAAAAVNEAVKLTRTFRKASASGLPGALSFPGGSGVRFSPKIAAPTLAKSVLNA